MSLPKGHQHAHWVERRLFRKDRDVPCEYCKTESYWREYIAQEIENAVIEVAGNSAETMKQAARIARGRK